MKELRHRGGIAVAIALAFGLAASAASAQVTDNVKNSKHNFSNATRLGSYVGVTTIEDYGEICVYCHTPHDGSATAPLWNRSDPATTGYTMYTSATLDMTRAAAPTGVSLACLSCHDGSIGIDVITNPPNSGGPFTATNYRINANANWANTPADFSDKNLTDDHPIAIQYSTTADVAFNSPTGSYVVSGSNKLPLYGANLEVQCGSCHNPHENASTKQPFLRMANTGSALCLTCHIK